jgi:ABC-type proline/glycine betaine transport system ATPase subunit
LGNSAKCLTEARRVPTAARSSGLVHEPPFRPFDDPFGALDALTREQMRTDLGRASAESSLSWVDEPFNGSTCVKSLLKLELRTT